MKYAPILPGKFAIRYSDRLLPVIGDYHLVLSKELTRTSEYFRFYKALGLLGHEIILDNCAYEDGKGDSIENLLELGDAINATQICLPDSRFNRDETLRAIYNTLDRVSELGMLGKIGLYAVPQGDSCETYTSCYLEISKIKEIDGIGIIEESGSVCGDSSRDMLLDRFYNNSWIVDKKYHLLGMEDQISNLQYYNKRMFSFATGMDSVKPIVFGLNNVALSKWPDYPYMHRPKDYFLIDEVNKYQLEIILANILQTKSMLGGI